jgi:hypothetical protein
MFRRLILISATGYVSYDILILSLPCSIAKT